MSVAQLKAASRKIIFSNSPAVFILCIIYLMAVTLLSEVAYRMPGSIDFGNMYDRLSGGEIFSITMIYSTFRPAGVVIGIGLYVLIKPVLDFGLMGTCLKMKYGSKSTYSDLLCGFRLYRKVMTIFIITSALVILWSMLLIIPGIVAAYKYRLSYYILLDDPEKSPLQCIDESALMMRGFKPDLFTVDMSFFGWYVLNITVILLLPLPFALSLVMIWLAPYRHITIAGFYEERKAGLAV